MSGYRPRSEAWNLVALTADKEKVLQSKQPELRRWFEAQETDPDICAQYRAVSDKHINTAAAYEALADLIERDRPREPP